ncbi:MAG: RraA family protein [Pseudomonadota bacterium]
MIEEPPLLTVAKHLRRPTDEQIAAFQGVPTGFVADAMDGTGALAPQIAPLGEGRDLPRMAAGPALTADCGPADVLAMFAALQLLRPGDILVSTVHGHQGCAAGGDRTMGMVKNNGGAAFVTDGPMRDYDGIVTVGVPVWCTGLSPASPSTTGPGVVGLPIVIGGRRVATGDMVVADRDGVVIVPFEDVAAVITRLAEIKVLEANLDAEVAAGRKHFDHVDKLMRSDAVRYTE